MFLVELLKAAGLGDEESLDKMIVELMGERRESENLANTLLGLDKKTEAFLEEQSRRFSEEPEAGELKRLTKKPLLEPIKEHSGKP